MWLNIGTFLIAMGVHFFKFPNNFNIGGVTGLAVVLGYWYPNISASLFMFILNTILLIIGYMCFGRSFGFKTTYSSLILSVMVAVMEKIAPMHHPLTEQPLMELIFAVILPGMGAAIIFNIRASNGGTDILGMLMKKYTSLNIGTALALADLTIASLNFIAFGPTSGLYSLLGLLCRATITDHVIESLNLHKHYTIITSNEKAVVDYITHNLNRSATKIKAEGAFSGQPKVMLITVLKRSQGVMLQHFLNEHDPEAFVYVTNTSKIIGKGFAVGMRDL